MSSERSVIANLVKNSLLIGALSFAVFLVVSLLLARWAVRPVELAWERQRQFVADASHELKTPLTVILSNAQLLGEAEGDPALRSRLRENILSMSARMRSLVESLLDLARVDSGLAGQTLSRVDLSRVVSEAILPFEPLFYERGLALSSSVEPGIAVKGSAERLSQAVGVLLDNAQKYASPGGSVSVTLSRQGRGHCLIAVENSGEPLSPGRAARHLQALLPRRRRAQLRRELRPRPLHRPRHSRGPPQPHLGRGPPRRQPILHTAQSSKNQNESAAGSPRGALILHKSFTIYPPRFSAVFQSAVLHWHSKGVSP